VSASDNSLLVLRLHPFGHPANWVCLYKWGVSGSCELPVAGYELRTRRCKVGGPGDLRCD
jgi:hypothetical protein